MEKLNMSAKHSFKNKDLSLLHTESEKKSPDDNFLIAIYLICSWI